MLMKIHEEMKYNLNFLLREREVFLVESIGDMLAMWEAGIKNCIVTILLFLLQIALRI